MQSWSTHLLKCCLGGFLTTLILVHASAYRTSRRRGHIPLPPLGYQFYCQSPLAHLYLPHFPLKFWARKTLTIVANIAGGVHICNVIMWVHIHPVSIPVQPLKSFDVHHKHIILHACLELPVMAVSPPAEAFPMTSKTNCKLTRSYKYPHKTFEFIKNNIEVSKVWGIWVWVIQPVVAVHLLHSLCTEHWYSLARCTI